MEIRLADGDGCLHGAHARPNGVAITLFSWGTLLFGMASLLQSDAAYSDINDLIAAIEDRNSNTRISDIRMPVEKLRINCWQAALNRTQQRPIELKTESEIGHAREKEDWRAALPHSRKCIELNRLVSNLDEATRLTLTQDSDWSAIVELHLLVREAVIKRAYRCSKADKLALNRRMDAVDAASSKFDLCHVICICDLRTIAILVRIIAAGRGSRFFMKTRLRRLSWMTDFRV
eukprot:IDg22217t1